MPLILLLLPGPGKVLGVVPDLLHGGHQAGAGLGTAGRTLMAETFQSTTDSLDIRDLSQ